MHAGEGDTVAERLRAAGLFEVDDNDPRSQFKLVDCYRFTDVHDDTTVECLRTWPCTNYTAATFSATSSNPVTVCVNAGQLNGGRIFLGVVHGCEACTKHACGEKIVANCIALGIEQDEALLVYDGIVVARQPLDVDSDPGGTASAPVHASVTMQAGELFFTAGRHPLTAVTHPHLAKFFAVKHDEVRFGIATTVQGQRATITPSRSPPSFPKPPPTVGDGAQPATDHAQGSDNSPRHVDGDVLDMTLPAYDGTLADEEKVRAWNSRCQVQSQRTVLEDSRFITFTAEHPLTTGMRSTHLCLLKDSPENAPDEPGGERRRSVEEQLSASPRAVSVELLASDGPHQLAFDVKNKGVVAVGLVPPEHADDPWWTPHAYSSLGIVFAKSATNVFIDGRKSDTLLDVRGDTVELQLSISRSQVLLSLDGKPVVLPAVSMKNLGCGRDYVVAIAMCGEGSSVETASEKVRMQDLKQEMWKMIVAGGSDSDDAVGDGAPEFPREPFRGSLSFEQANNAVSLLGARRIVCRRPAPLGACVSREVIDSSEPFQLAFELSKMKDHTIAIGFVSDKAESLALEASRTMIGSDLLAPGTALMLNPYFVGVVVDGFVRAAHPLRVGDGSKVFVSRNSEGQVSFVVNGTRLPQLITWGANTSVRVGVSLTARGQDVAFLSDTVLPHVEDATPSQLDASMPVSYTKYDEVISFMPNLPAITIGGDCRTVRCLEPSRATGATWSSTPKNAMGAIEEVDDDGVPIRPALSSFASELATRVRVESQQVISLPDGGDFALPVSVEDCTAPIGVGLRSISGVDYAIGVWIRPGDTRGTCVAQIWDTRGHGLRSTSLSVNVEHAIHITISGGPARSSPDNPEGGDAQVTFSVNGSAMPPFPVPTSRYRAVLMFTEASQQAFLGMTLPGNAKRDPGKRDHVRRHMRRSTRIAEAIPLYFLDDPAVPSSVRTTHEFVDKEGKHARSMGNDQNEAAKVALSRLPVHEAALVIRRIALERMFRKPFKRIPEGPVHSAHATTAPAPANPLAPMVWKPASFESESGRDGQLVRVSDCVFSLGAFERIQCDRCLAGNGSASYIPPLMGTVYTCKRCPDTDFCFACFHDEHSVVGLHCTHRGDPANFTVRLGGGQWEADAGVAQRDGEIVVALFEASKEPLLRTAFNPHPDSKSKPVDGVYWWKLTVAEGARVALRLVHTRFIWYVDGSVAGTIHLPGTLPAMRFAVAAAADMLRPMDSVPLAAPPPPGAPVQIDRSTKAIQSEVAGAFDIDFDDDLPKSLCRFAGRVGTAVRHLLTGVSAVVFPGEDRSVCMPTMVLVPVARNLTAPVPTVPSITKGDRVVANPQDWRFGDQDGNSGNSARPTLGTVTEVLPAKRLVKVRWDGKSAALTYRYGRKQRYDVVLAPVRGKRVVRNPAFWTRNGGLDGEGTAAGTVVDLDVNAATATVDWPRSVTRDKGDVAATADGSSETTRVVHVFSRFYQEVQVASPYFSLPMANARETDNAFSSSDEDEERDDADSKSSFSALAFMTAEALDAAAPLIPPANAAEVPKFVEGLHERSRVLRSEWERQDRAESAHEELVRFAIEIVKPGFEVIMQRYEEHRRLVRVFGPPVRPDFVLPGIYGDLDFPMHTQHAVWPGRQNNVLVAMFRGEVVIRKRFAPVPRIPPSAMAGRATSRQCALVRVDNELRMLAQDGFRGFLPELVGVCWNTPPRAADDFDGGFAVFYRFYPGGNFDVWARRNKDNPQAIILAIRALATALITIHADNIVHRDLKPGNIVMSEDGPDARPIIIDWEFAYGKRGSDVPLLDLMAENRLFLQSSSKSSNKSGPIGYTEGFAAPEVLELAQALEEQRPLREEDEERLIAPSIDTFSFGRIVGAIGSLFPQGTLVSSRLAEISAMCSSHAVADRGALDAVCSALDALMRDMGSAAASTQSQHTGRTHDPAAFNMGSGALQTNRLSSAPKHPAPPRSM